MNTFRYRLITLIVAIACLPAWARAQYADEEYRMELGVRLGGCFYMGDANYTTPFKDMGLSAGVVGRFILNPRMAIKCDLAMGKISGDTRTIDNAFPYGAECSFERTVYDLGAQFEYNFWPYGNGLSYKESRRFTPYALGGLGFTYADKPAESVFAMNLVLGAGVKYKFAPRWNVGCEFSMRFTSTDKLDVPANEGLQLADPYQIKGGLWKNKDSYSFVSLTLTYDLWPKCNNCNKN